jgi:hypothetical protein
MRFLLLSCALVLAGCGNGSSAPEDFAMPQDLSVPPPDLALNCVQTCPSCTTGTTCVTSAGGLTPFSASCLAGCTSDVNCTGGRKCVEIYGASPAGRYCLNTTEPQSCGPMCDLVQATSFCSGSEVVAPYSNIVCGAVYTHCATGCVEDEPDGGTNRHAHCL